MGQLVSKEDEEEYLELKDLGAVRLAQIGHQFNELYSDGAGQRGVLLDRQAFAKHFQLPLILGDRLFEAFDVEKNGVVSFEEFARGLAICLHGSTTEKCDLLFQVFNLAGDEGVSREELHFMLHATLESAHTILKACRPGSSAVSEGVTLSDSVKRCVEEAFSTCDISGTGKLLPNEFEMWIRRNPAVLDSILNWRTREKSAREPTSGHPTLLPADQSRPSSATPENSSDLDITIHQAGDIADSDPVLADTASADCTTEDVPEVDALEVTIPSQLLDKDATMESIDIKGDSFLSMATGAFNQSTSIPSVDITAEAQTNSVGSSSLQDEVNASTLQDDINTSTLQDEAKQPVEPAEEEGSKTPPQYTTGVANEALLQGAATNVLDEVRLNTPRTTPSISRHATPAPSADAARISPILMEAAPHVRTQGSSTPSVSTPVAARAETESITSPPAVDSPKSIRSASSDSAGGPETPDGRFHRKKKTHLPPAVFSGGQVHMVDEPGRTGATSPLYENDFECSASEQVAVERRRTSWLASPQTQQLIANMATGAQLSRVDQSFLTMPGLILDDAQSDPVRDLLTRYGLEAEARDRHILNVDSVTMDNVGLQKLLGSGCYRAALELTSRFLTAHGQGLGQSGQPALHTHKTLQMWLARVALLMKLGQFTVAHNELKAFGSFDSPDMYFDYYPDAYPGRTGSMVPFSLRLLHATIPQYAGQPAEALDRLQRIKDHVKSMIRNLKNGLSEDGQVQLVEGDSEASLQLWEQRLIDVDYAMANALLAIKNYDLAVQVFFSIAERETASAPLLLSLIGRVYLQLGDLLSGREAFTAAENKAEDVNSDLLRKLQAMHKGFMDVTAGRYQDAFRHFQGVLRVESYNAIAINNMAVCLLYTGKLTEAVQILEELVWKDPPTHLQAATICNLCTLYELQSAKVNDKKLKLLRLVAKYCGDGFPAESLKLV